MPGVADWPRISSAKSPGSSSIEAKMITVISESVTTP
jgi:hypothetical protein